MWCGVIVVAFLDRDVLTPPSKGVQTSCCRHRMEMVRSRLSLARRFSGPKNPSFPRPWVSALQLHCWSDPGAWLGRYATDANTHSQSFNISVPIDVTVTAKVFPATGGWKTQQSLKPQACRSWHMHLWTFPQGCTLAANSFNKSRSAAQSA